MTEPLDSYLPQDRRRALGGGPGLSERTTGSALFGDITGFTSLSLALVDAQGSRRGVEVLSRHLNRVYETLITRTATSIQPARGNALVTDGRYFEIDDYR